MGKRIINIGFTGKAGSGKTTIANELVDRYGFIKLSFAAPLKKIAEQIFMRPMDKTNPADRRVLQQLGTDIGRTREKDIWVRHLDFHIKNTDFIPPNPNFTVDDCRFINERDYLKSQGFLIIRMVGRQSSMNQSLKNHASEIEQESIEVDFELDNSGTVEETIVKLLAYLETVPSETWN